MVVLWSKRDGPVGSLEVSFDQGRVLSQPLDCCAGCDQIVKVIVAELQRDGCGRVDATGSEVVNVPNLGPS